MNTVELGQFTLTQLAQQQTASRTQLVGDSHAYVTPTDTFPTATQYRASQQAYNRYLGFDSASPLRPSIATAGSLIFPIAVVPNTPGVFNARMHQPCNTCASQSCVCAHLVSLSFTSAELKIPVTLTHYDLRNSSYRLTLYRAPSVPSPPREGELPKQGAPASTGFTERIPPRPAPMAARASSLEQPIAFASASTPV